MLRDAPHERKRENSVRLGGEIRQAEKIRQAVWRIPQHGATALPGGNMNDQRLPTWPMIACGLECCIGYEQIHGDAKVHAHHPSMVQPANEIRPPVEIQVTSSTSPISFSG
jgi:hypothetical protein